ncbi:MAG: hypothetical protein ACLRMH_14445, partial [Lachnospiraceae bacterium]
MKRWKQLLAGVLSAALLVGTVLPALPVQAAWTGVQWPGLGIMSGATNYEYLDRISNESEIYNNVLHQTYGYGAWIDIPEDVATSFTIKDYSFSTSYKHPTIFEDIETGKTYDLTTPVCFWATETDTGRTHPYYLMAAPWKEKPVWTEEDK